MDSRVLILKESFKVVGILVPSNARYAQAKVGDTITLEMPAMRQPKIKLSINGKFVAMIELFEAEKIARYYALEGDVRRNRTWTNL